MDEDTPWDMYQAVVCDTSPPPLLCAAAKKPYRMCIDVREPESLRHFFTERLQHEYPKVHAQVHVEVCALDIADVVLYEGEQPLVYIERKTLDDLLASIRDGRHRNQKYRLLEQSNMNPNRIMYLYEGAVRGTPSRWYGAFGKRHVCNMRTIIGAQCNTLFRDGVHVWRTGSLEETILFLVTLLSKMHHESWMREHWERACAAVERSEDTEAYAHTLRMPRAPQAKRGKRAAPRDMYLCFLAQIPGMSFARAEAVAAQYPTVDALVQAVRETPDAFATVQVNGTRKLGPKVASRIIDVVLGRSSFRHPA